MDKAEMRRLDAANTSFCEQGQGVPVVLVHGSGCDYRIWDAQRERIASAYRYIALNLHYHGTDPWPDDGKNYSVLYHAAQLTAFLRTLGAGPGHLVGQSYGAHVVTRVAMDIPELVCSLVLQEPAIPSLIEGPDVPEIMEERKRAFGPAGLAIAKGEFDLGTRLLMEALINEGPGTWDLMPEYLQTMALENARTLPLMFAASPAPTITCAQLHQLTMPTLVLNGARTMRFFSHIGERVAKCIPRAQREVIADASHGIETQNPAAYWQALNLFLAQQSKDAASII